MTRKTVSSIRQHLVPFSVLLISLLAALVCWRTVQRYEQREVNIKFSQTAEDYQRLLERRLIAYAHFLDGLGGLFSVNQSVSRQDFEDYINHINIFDNYPGTKRIGYLPIVPVQRKTSHETQMRAAGFVDYQIKSTEPQAEYFPYDYLYPYDDGAKQHLLGMDEHNEPARKEALQKARDWNKVVATGKLRKVLVPSRQVSFLLYAPIYKKGMPIRTISQRREAIKGYVYAAFRAEDLIRAAWGEELAHIAEVRFKVGNAASSNDVLYDSTRSDTAALQCSQCFKYTGMFEAAGQQWLLQLYPRPAFYKLRQEDSSWIVLVCGVLISFLLAAIAVLINGKRQRARLQQEQNQKFRSLFDQNPDAIYSLDLKGCFTEANAAAIALFGVSTSDLIGEPYISFIATDYLEDSKKRFTQITNGASTYAELVFINSARDRVEVSATGCPILSNGKIIGIFCIAKNITTRKAIEAQNKQMRQFLDATLENLPTTLFVKEARTLRYVAWNRAAEELMGISREEIIGRTDYDLFSKEEADYFTCSDRELLSRGESMDVLDEAVHTRHQGVRLMFVRKAPFRMGKALYLLGLCEDVTERRQAEEALKQAHAELEERVKQRTQALRHEIEARKKSEQALLESEEKYRSIFEQAPVGIAHMGEDGKLNKINQQFCDIVGYSAEELSHLTYLDITHPDDLEKSLDLVRQVNGREVISTSREKRYIRKDGSEVWVQVTRSAILDADNEFKYYLGIIEDITQRKQAEAALRELAGYLEAAREDERTRIAREIHDELGGALTAVKFELSVPTHYGDADQNGISQRNRETLKLVDNAIVALRRIMTDLRPSVLDDLGLWSALEWLTTEFQSRMKIQTTFKLKGDEIDVEPNRATSLFRMVQEALNNVAKHAQATAVSIAAAKTGNEITIRIKDNGRGISKGEKSKAKSFGLMGMQERVQAFGGVVKISGRLGEGTTVFIRCPMSDK